MKALPSFCRLPSPLATPNLSFLSWPVYKMQMCLKKTTKTEEKDEILQNQTLQWQTAEKWDIHTVQVRCHQWCWLKARLTTTVTLMLCQHLLCSGKLETDLITTKKRRICVSDGGSCDTVSFQELSKNREQCGRFHDSAATFILQRYQSCDWM